MVSLVLLAATIFFFAKFSFHAGSSERPCYKVGMHERHFERLGINHVFPLYYFNLQRNVPCKKFNFYLVVCFGLLLCELDNLVIRSCLNNLACPKRPKANFKLLVRCFHLVSLVSII